LVLELIDESIEAFLRATVPLSAADVDVSFEAPEREWSAKLNRPTVNLFLWDIGRSSERARSGVETIERNGRMVRRMALPMVELRYLVTAWTSDHRDERSILSGLLRSLLVHSSIPAQFRPDGLAGLDAPTISLRSSEKAQVDVFKTLEGQLKPAINIVVTTEFDLELETELAPPVVEFEVGISDRSTGARTSVRRIAGEVDVPGSVGLRVVSPRGSAVVNAASRFLVAAAPGDEISLLSEPVRTIVAPEQGGVVIR
jgi:hypothetical protein